jgi:hypothetical protein
MELQAVIEQQNSLMQQMLNKLTAIESKLGSQDRDTCGPKEAMEILGLTNVRHLTYFYRIQSLNRRKGSSEGEKAHFLYYKDECKELARRIRSGEVKIPTMSEMYGRDE